MVGSIAFEPFSSLLKARTGAEVEAVLARLPVTSPEDYQWDSAASRLATWRSGFLHWVPVGFDRGNGGRIRLAGEPMNPIAERLVNGMESLIEQARLTELRADAAKPMPADPRDAVQRYFGLPRLDAIERADPATRRELRDRVNAVRHRLAVHLDHDSRSRDFSVTVRDVGMGQTPARMHRTLLSLGQSDKADKPYLIGVFGQGGSSAFSVSRYSVVASRRAPGILQPGEDDGAGWSVVREIRPKGRRDVYYAYLAAAETGEVPRVDAAVADAAGFEHGAHFCHIGYDFGGSKSAVTRLLYQALNHVLFSPVLPYDLFAGKDKPEPMLGTMQRLARQVRVRGRQAALDKAFPSQRVA